jgi:hypothetical protein
LQNEGHRIISFRSAPCILQVNFVYQELTVVWNVEKLGSSFNLVTLSHCVSLSAISHINGERKKRVTSKIEIVNWLTLPSSEIPWPGVMAYTFWEQKLVANFQKTRYFIMTCGWHFSDWKDRHTGSLHPVPSTGVEEWPSP